MLELDDSRIGLQIEDFNDLVKSFKTYYSGAYLDCSNTPSLHFFDSWNNNFANDAIIQSICSSSAVNEIEYVKKMNGNHFRIGELAFFGGMNWQDFTYLDLDPFVFTSSDGSIVSYDYVTNWIKNDKLIRVI